MTVIQRHPPLTPVEEASWITSIFLALAHASMFSETPEGRARIAHLEAQLDGLADLEFLP